MSEKFLILCSFKDGLKKLSVVEAETKITDMLINNCQRTNDHLQTNYILTFFYQNKSLLFLNGKMVFTIFKIHFREN